jgi:pilus assembly protein CpaF
MSFSVSFTPAEGEPTKRLLTRTDGRTTLDTDSTLPEESPRGSQRRSGPHHHLFDSHRLPEVREALSEQRNTGANSSPYVLHLGPLSDLLADTSITEILVTGPHRVFVERLGRVEQAPVQFESTQKFLEAIRALAWHAGSRLDERSPILETRLPDGTRVHAMVPPLAVETPVLLLRRAGARLRSLDLLALGVLPRPIMEFLEASVVARLNILIYGEPGSGKTTLLNALCRSIPHNERIICVESGMELKLEQPHVIRLDSRFPQADVSTNAQVLRQALQCRPDRVILGDATSFACADVWQVVTLGHCRILLTLPAHDPQEVLARLESLALTAAAPFSRRWIRRCLTAHPAILVGMVRTSGSGRRVGRVAELSRSRRRCRYKLRDLFVWKPATERLPEGVFVATGRIPRSLAQIQAAGIEISEVCFTHGDLR